MVGAALGGIGAVALFGALWLLGVVPGDALDRAYRSARALVESASSPGTRPWSDVIRFDPQIGWRGRPNLDVHCRADEVFRLVTGPDGWRGTTTVEDADVVVFGDSFALGYGVGEAEHFAQLVSGTAVKAIGMPGYNLAQELLLLEEYADRLAGKLVVWLVFLGNDLYESVSPHMMEYPAPYASKENGAFAVRRDHLRSERIDYDQSRHVEVYLGNLAALCSTDQRAADPWFEACAYLLERGRQVCERAGADLVVVSVPDLAQLTDDGLDELRRHGERAPGTAAMELDADLPDRRLAAICGAIGLPFVAGKARLRRSHYNRHDRHWNASGHHAVAAILSDCRERSR